VRTVARKIVALPCPVINRTDEELTRMARHFFKQLLDVMRE
jgi:hypothetical protein